MGAENSATFAGGGVVRVTETGSITVTAGDFAAIVGELEIRIPFKGSVIYQGHNHLTADQRREAYRWLALAFAALGEM